jgi:RHS repeat-associated protein
LQENYKFSQKERDAETSLQYFEARYLGSVIPRFASVDAFLAAPESLLSIPQDLNAYSYTRNNPLNLRDPSGNKTVGELIDFNGVDAARKGNYARAYGWAVLSQAWGFFGAEGVSKVTDTALNSRNDLTAGDIAAATIEVATAVTGARALVKAGKALTVGEAAAKEGAELLSESAAKGAAAEKQLGKLRNVGANSWESSEGLSYRGLDKKGLNRVEHVLEHTVANPSKPVHSVFNVPRTKVLALVDEAWGSAARVPVPKDPGAFVTPLGRVVGTSGENAVKIIVRPGTSEVITAYPIKWP